jgi:hypothetical protein
MFARSVAALVALPSDDTAKEHYGTNCHANVATIANWYDGLKHVFGYLVLSPSMTGEPHWIVMAHSLIEPPEGGLIEVTPDAEYGGSSVHPARRRCCLA